MPAVTVFGWAGGGGGGMQGVHHYHVHITIVNMCKATPKHAADIAI
jgi:hypothetical protein